MTHILPLAFQQERLIPSKQHLAPIAISSKLFYKSLNKKHITSTCKLTSLTGQREHAVQVYLWGGGSKRQDGNCIYETKDPSLENGKKE